MSYLFREQVWNIIENIMLGQFRNDFPFRVLYTKFKR